MLDLNIGITAIFMNRPSFKHKQKTIFERLKYLRENPTPSEVIFLNRLKEARINFIFQKGFIEGNYYCIVDFYLPRPNKIVVEIDGGYHNDALQVFKDNNRDRYLKEYRGFEVVRIKNEDVETFDLSIFK